MQNAPYALPLTPGQFAAALQKGQGRAMQHARAAGGKDLAEAIINACIHNQAYDPQCEWDRAEWVFEILRASGLETPLADSLLDQLSASTDDFWDASHRCRIALLLAKNGHSKAREVVYSSLRRSKQSNDVIGMEDVIALDGADGLIHVAEFLGRQLETEDGFWIAENPLRWFDDSNGQGAARRVLADAARHSPAVARYLVHIDERRQEVETADHTRPVLPPPDSTGYNLSDKKETHAEKMRRIPALAVVRTIETANPQHHLYWLNVWGREASDKAVADVFEAMVQESDPARLCKYLRVFMERALPTFDPRMLPFADHASTEVRDLSHRALSNYQHPDVRSLALQRLAQGRWSESELELFKKNFQRGDAARLSACFQLLSDRDEFHALISDLVDVFKANKVAELQNAMLFVYEESPCSTCRGRAVEELIATGTAPQWLLEECKDDSSDSIREPVGAAKRSPESR